MAMQTVTQNDKTFFVGSAKLEIATYAAPNTWIDLGGANGIKLAESYTKTDIRADNITKPIQSLITDKQVIISAELFEWDFDVLKVLKSGIMSYAAVTAAPVVGETDEYAASATDHNIFYPFAHQSYPAGVLTVPGTISVSQDYDVTPEPLVLDTDYSVVKSGNEWGIMFIDGGSYAPTKSQEITYTYTPVASKTLTGLVTATSPVAFMLKATNENALGKKKIWTFYNVTVNKGFELTLPSQNATDLARLPIELLCTPDDDNDQFWSWLTEAC